MLHVVVFHTLKTLFHCLLAFIVSAEKFTNCTKVCFYHASFCNRRERGRAQLFKQWHSPGQNINRLESHKTKAADKTRPWSSISKWNDTPRGAMTVSRHCEKTKEWVVAQILKISTPSQKSLEESSRSLAYEITQSVTANCATFCSTLTSVMAHTLSVRCASLWIWIKPLLTYCFVSHWILPVLRHQEHELH